MAGLPDISRRTLLAAYERALDERPDEVAQVGRDGSWTFAGSFDRSLRLAAGLRAAGGERGQPVALLLDNSLDAAHTWSGIGLGGMVEVPVNTAYVGGFLSHVLNDSGAEVLVTEDRYVERVMAVADDLTSLRTLVVRGDLAAAGQASAAQAAGAGRAAAAQKFRVVPFGEAEAATPLPPAPARPEDLIAYMYTSGTTGMSKGVLTGGCTPATRSAGARTSPASRSSA